MAGRLFDNVADILLCVDVEQTAEFLVSPLSLMALETGAILIAWTEKSELVSLRASHSAHYVQRAMAGVLLRDQEFAKSRVAILHEALEQTSADLQLSLWSNSPLPALKAGFFEAQDAVPSSRPFVASAHDVPDADERARALTERLLVIEDRTFALRAEIRRLNEELTIRVGAAGPDKWLDAPRTGHEWPLADNGVLGGSLYDRRPDDSVIRQAKLGDEFLSTFGLDTEESDFVGAVAALNAIDRMLLLSHEQPDVSIIIPVYGQLSYTLNCIDSLMLHKSRYTAEIIVIDDCSIDGLTEVIVPAIMDIRYYRQRENGGFINSCNCGGALANGKYIVLLNNDTRVVDGWLDNLIYSFELFPGAGLVGSKMLYPDGTLQEAGAILWRDGSAWNYGRGDDPNRPQYCYARQVDYISGCSIALPADLWREMGGFDPYFSPAYAEDADLAQRVIARDLEVWFQPTSRVIHYEGKTSGTETSSGAKAWQIVNLRKLFLRWRVNFESHRRSGEAPFFEKDRGVNKRMLFVDAVTPTPDQDAGSVQTVLGLRCARRIGYKVNFVPEDNWLFEPKYTMEMQREGIECFYAPFNVGFENFIRDYGSLFDVVIVYRINVMQKCLPLVRKYAPEALALFHVADLHHLRMQRQAELEQDDDLARAALELREKEFDIIFQSDCTITHSSVEAELIQAKVAGAAVTVWPLMMEVVGTNVDFVSRHDLCFLGGYSHYPNVDAVLFFVHEVFPLIRSIRPDIKFFIVGANPTPEIVALANDNIIVTGMVESLADVFDKTRIFVCPLRYGAGAKGKIMSALAHGLPVVSTSVGIEGAGLSDGEQVLVADGPEAIAETILRVYEDTALWRQLSAAGLSTTADNFSLDIGSERLKEAIEKGYKKRLGLTTA